MIPVAVVGASGFMGSELVRILHSHPNVDLTYLAGHSTSGQLLEQSRPGFSDSNLQIKPTNALAISQVAETVFLALPHGESAEIAAQLLDLGKTVIDLGSDFRLKKTEDVTRYYGRSAPSQDLLDRAFYCLPELTGAPPAGTKLIACPGCFATALNLTVAALAPIAKTLQIHGITGSSGSGISPSTGVHHSLRTTNFVAYKPLNHQHLGEVNQLQNQLGHSVNVHFVPHSAPVVRGIHLTTLVPHSPEKVGQLLNDKYQNLKGISIHSGPVPLGAVIQTNRVLLGFSGDPDCTAVFCAIDNLLKGGSGQAVQILNLMNGFDEFAGLPMIAPWP